MAATTSRIPGFHKTSIPARRGAVSEATGTLLEELESALQSGGLSAQTADKIVENVIGTYALPFGVVLNARINDRDYVVPMVVEEPSVIAAASNAAKMIRAGGGFQARADASIMACQVQVHGASDPAAGRDRILERKHHLLDRAAEAVAELVALGGGPRDLDVRVLAEDMLVVHVYTDCKDAMGANMVNAIAESIGDDVAQLAGGRLGLRILSNLCDRRLVRVTCHAPASAIATDTVTGEDVVDGVVNASRFAELDPYRAATHNKGIMNGVDPVVIATGNDWRAVEAGAHAYAGRSGKYGPLAIWRKHVANDGTVMLAGSIELPLSLGIVGGTLRVHPAARLALRIMNISTAAELSMIAASVGLASNLAALRALATEGIQRGHMSLHARSVAVTAGAVGDEVERVAKELARVRVTTVDQAKHVLAALRAGPR
jgi:hydroxymethylglutaryl-CoA reductase